MIFVIDNLKYDTDKMELISEKCKYTYKWTFVLTDTQMSSMAHDVKIWRSKKGNWLLTYTRPGYSADFANTLSEIEVKSLLLRYDLPKYEEVFGQLEEA